MTNDLTTYKEALLDPSFCDQAIRLAQLMAKAETLPAHLKGKPADILRVIEMAHRAGQSPFAVADKTFFVGGKIAFEGQLVAGLINSHRSIEERLDYDYEGDEDKPTTLKCTVSARLRGESKRRTVRVTWVQGEAQSKGAKDKWKSQPAQQLAYFGARVWARRHAPEILLGLYTPEEIETQHIGPEHAVDVTPASAGFGRARFAEPEPNHDPQTGEVIEAGNGQNASPPPSPAKITKAQAEAIRDAFLAADSPDDYWTAQREHQAALDALQKRNGPSWQTIDRVMQAVRQRLKMEVAPGDDPMAELDDLDGVPGDDARDPEAEQGSLV